VNAARGWRLLFALAAGAAALGLAVGGSAVFFAGVLLFAAGPLVRWAAPREPAVLKTLLFTVLFSPPLVAAVWMASSGLAARREVAIGAALLLLLAGALKGKDEAAPEPERLGRAQVLAVALSVGFALLVGLALFQGVAARASFHGLLHSSILQVTANGLPPENPWLAGEPLGYYWVWHALGAAVGDVLWLAPTKALALLNVWSAATLPLSLYFFAAPLWQRGGRDLASVGLGLLGLNLLGGFVWIAGGAHFVAPAASAELLANLRELVTGGVDPRLAWGPSKFGNLSSYPAALAMLAGGLVAAGHALRGGAPNDGLEAASRRVWMGLAGIGLGLSCLLNPLVGAAGFLAAGGVALMRRRWGFLLVAVLASVPSALEVLAAGARRGESGVELGLRSEGLWGPLLALAPLLFGALVVVVLARPREVGARAFFDLAWVGAATSFVIAVVVVLPEHNEYKFVRTAALFLAPLAAGAPFVLWARGGGLRLAGGLLAVLFVIGATTGSYLGGRSYAAWSHVPMALSEAGGRLTPTGDSAVSRAMVELQTLSAASSARPVLVAELPGNQAPGWDFGGMRFDGGFNLQGHAAAAFSGAALFCDRRSYIVDADPAWPMRLGIVRALFEGRAGAGLALKRALEAPGLAKRPHYLLSVSGPLPATVRSELGWDELWSSGDVRIYAPKP